MHSERAREWFERSADEHFFFCRFTQIAALRLVTTKEIMAKDTRNMSEAWNLWDKIWLRITAAISESFSGYQEVIFACFFSTAAMRV